MPCPALNCTRWPLSSGWWRSGAITFFFCFVVPAEIFQKSSSAGQEENLDCPFYSHSPTEGGRRQRRLTGSDDDSCADALFLVDSNCSSKKCIRCHVDNKKAPGDHPILILIMIIVIISSPAAFQLFISIIYCSSPKETIRCCCCSSSGGGGGSFFGTRWSTSLLLHQSLPLPPTSTECNFNWFSNIYKRLRI